MKKLLLLLLCILLIGCSSAEIIWIHNANDVTYSKTDRLYYDGSYLSDEVVYEKDGRFGILDKTLSVVIEAKYEDIKKKATGDYYPAKINGLWGYLDKEGKWAIEPQFTEANEFTSRLALVRKDGLDHFIDERGGSPFFPYRYAKPFVRDLAVVSNDDSTTTLIDPNGKTVKTFEGFIEVLPNDRFVLHKGSHFEILDGEYNVIQTFDGVKFATTLKNNLFSEDLYLVSKDGKHYEVFNEKGERITEEYVQAVYSTGSLQMILSLENGKALYYNEEKVKELPFTYVVGARGNHIVILDGEKQKIVNLEGKQLTDLTFDDVRFMNDQIVVLDRGITGIIER
ncbi:WG repeat-containing protein [Guggenheimella bovis]